MKRIYEAEHITQAHLLRALLEQQGIHARVDGEYLQGGIGEIGVAGLIGISVEDHQVEAARRLIEDFEHGQSTDDETSTEEPPVVSPTSPENANPSAAWNSVALAVVGAVVVFLLYQLALLIWVR